MIRFIFVFLCITTNQCPDSDHQRDLGRDGHQHFGCVLCHLYSVALLPDPLRHCQRHILVVFGFLRVRTNWVLPEPSELLLHPDNRTEGRNDLLPASYRSARP